MGVQGYLSLYTTLLGWQEYDALWRLMASLGFLALPFMFMAYRAFSGPFLSMGAKDAGIMGARRFIFQLTVGLMILLFAGVPTVHLDPNVLHFTPRCNAHDQSVTPGHTGTTYDHLLPVPQDVKVPLLWYVVLAWSNGITDTAEDTLSCPTVNLRALQSELSLTSIQSASLKAEVHQFYQACYLPAYNKFVQDNDTQAQHKLIQHALQVYGQSDIAWIGSETFQTVRGFYNRYYATSAVKGFPYRPNRPQDQIEGQVGRPTWGVPSCLQWWQDPRHGLRTALFNQLSKKARKRLSKLNKQGDQGVLVQDAAIRAIVEKSAGGNLINPGYVTEENGKSGVDNFLAKWGAKGYTDVLAIEEYPKIHLIENALPIIQAVLLAAVIMLLAIALPSSGYSFSFCATASVFLFSLTFCSFLWHWVSWFDQFLLQALYGVSAVHHEKSTWRLILHMTSAAVNPEKILVDITISTFYLLLPFVWLAVAGWAGVQMGQSLMGFAESGGHGSSVGRSNVAGAKIGVRGLKALIFRRS